MEFPKEQFDALGILLGGMRISVGLGNDDDLIHELSSALESIA